MSEPILNLSAAPEDPVERVMWLSGVAEAAHAELDEAFADAYFEARLEGRLETAIKAGPYAKKRVLAYTRAENERRGRTVRWGDGADATSTAYDPSVWSKK
jgi:hypothetical protein